MGDAPLLVAERRKLEIDPEQVASPRPHLHIVATTSPAEARWKPAFSRSCSAASSSHTMAIPEGLADHIAGWRPAISIGARLASRSTPSRSRDADVQGEEVVERTRRVKLALSLAMGIGISRAR